MWFVCGFIAGLLVTFSLMYFRLRSVTKRLEALTEQQIAATATLNAQEEIKTDLKSRLREAEQALIEANAKAQSATVELSSLTAAAGERDAAHEKQRLQMADDRETLKSAFMDLSVQALRTNGEDFLVNAKREFAIDRQATEGALEKRRDEIKQLVKPIEEGIKAVDEAARTMEKTRLHAFGRIEEQLQASALSAAEVARQAASLKDALKRPNVRGRWGEVQLQVCVNLSGMDQHCDIVFQESSITAEGELLRPDMTVRMPGGKKIFVDSKVPMDHFIAYIEATDEEDKSKALQNHGKSARTRVNDLAKVEYQTRIAGSPDFTVMFLPNESFLSMALESEPTLVEDALSKKILIATPGTLIGLLRVVQYGWSEQIIAQNAAVIASEGTKLATELTRFISEFAELGLAIDDLNNAFHRSRNRVEKKLVRGSLRLGELGIKAASSPKGSKRLKKQIAEIYLAGGADEEELADAFGEELALAAESDDSDDPAT